MAATNSKQVEQFTFARATRAQIPLLIGLAGGTGSGKTWTAMELATGMSRGKPFAVIDTENGRAKHYGNEFVFDCVDLGPPFRPERYEAAILAADAAGYPVIVVDSCSHIWAGDGGILDWQEEELDRMAGQDWQKREACKMAAWIRPKLSHKHFVTRLLQVRAHVILCFRAESKIEIVKENGKWKAVPKASPVGLDGWLPICEKNLPFELTCSFLLTADAPGVPKPIKLPKQHRPFFPLDKPITRAAGEQLARWAAGEDLPTPAGAANASATVAAPPTVADYDACVDRGAFDALERRRADAWKTLKPGPEKTAIKAASDAAAARLRAATAQPEPLTLSSDPAAAEAEALAALVAAYKRGPEALQSEFARVENAYAARNEPIPLAVDAKYGELNESLKE